MTENISLEQLYEFYIDCISNCGCFLLSLTDDEIEYKVFEEFVIGVHTFLHRDNLIRLLEGGFISKDTLYKSDEIRNKVFLLDNSDQWNILSVRTSHQWREIMKMTDQVFAELDKNKV